MAVIGLSVCAALATAPVHSAAQAAPARDSATDAAVEVVADQPVVAAMFYSRFCGACLILDPRMDAVEDAYQGRPVTFVTFDQTLSAVTGARLEALAQTHGVERIWEKNKGKTGFALLIDPSTQTVLDVIMVRDDGAAIRAKLDAALTRAKVS